MKYITLLFKVCDLHCFQTQAVLSFNLRSPTETISHKRNGKMQNSKLKTTYFLKPKAWETRAHAYNQNGRLRLVRLGAYDHVTDSRTLVDK